MKILYLDYDDTNNPYASGGQAHTTRELTRRLSVKHKITVVTGNYPNANNQIIFGVKFMRIGIGNLGHFISILSYWIFLPLFVYFNQKKYDIIFESFTAPFAVSFVPYIVKKPLIAQPMFFNPEKLSEKYHLPLDIFLKLIIKKYHKFIVMTEELGKKVKQLNPKASYTVIPGGITQDYLVTEPLRGKYILYIGRIDIFNKGLDLLIDAWKNINEKLIIAGSGKLSEEKKLKELIKKNNLDDKINYIGKVYGRKKTNLYRNALFIVQPSLFETFGYVALETLAIGKLLVCFDIQGFKWIPNKYALKIKEISSYSLEKSIKKVLKSPIQLERLSPTNKKFAQSFNWNSIAKLYEKELHKYE